jgi:hypothetical protein
MTNPCHSSAEAHGVMGTRTAIDLTVDQPQARFWDRIADVFSPSDRSPWNASTSLAVLAYVSGSEGVKEEGR